MAILSFSEFQELYEANYENNAELYNEETEFEYYDGFEILEELFNLINESDLITETEVNLFFDTVLEGTGWELNDDIYESYHEWLTDFSYFIDEGINEDNEAAYVLTHRAKLAIEEAKKAEKTGIIDKIKTTAGKAGGAIGGAAKGAGAGISKGAKAAGGFSNSTADKVGSALGSKKHSRAAGYTAMGVGAAGLAGGAYLGAKALKRRKERKAADAQQQQQQQQKR